MTGPGVVAFLFTDLVGSTELIDHLGDDAADHVRRGHFELLRQAVADSGGQEVKKLDDGLMVSFASPVAALRCATAMQQAVASSGLDLGQEGLLRRLPIVGLGRMVAPITGLEAIPARPFAAALLLDLAELAAERGAGAPTTPPCASPISPSLTGTCTGRWRAWRSPGAVLRRDRDHGELARLAS